MKIMKIIIKINKNGITINTIAMIMKNFTKNIKNSKNNFIINIINHKTIRINISNKDLEKKIKSKYFIKL